MLLIPREGQAGGHSLVGSAAALLGEGGPHFANPEDAWAAAAWALSKGAGWSALGPVLGKWETELCNEQKARWSFLVKFALLGGRRSGGGEGRSELVGPSGVFMKRDTSSLCPLKSCA